MAYPHKDFGKGDTIIGNFRNKYGVTARGVRHEVIDTDYGSHNTYEDIKVRVLEGKDKGFSDWVNSSKFDLVEKARPKTAVLTINDKGDLTMKGNITGKNVNLNQTNQYTTSYDRNLQTTFIRVGDVTIAVPVEEKFVSITVKHPEDVECDEIAKAVAYYRLAKGVK